jgi:hypothetical protein
MLILILVTILIILIILIINTNTKPKRENEIFERIFYLWKNNIPFSGVELEYRIPFGIGIFEIFDMYHLSLKIVDKKTGKVRRIGSGSVGGLESEFVSHYYSENSIFYPVVASIPIECWTKYKRKMGHFPGELHPIDVDKLNQLTKTRGECENGESVYRTTFGSIITGIDGEKTVSTCISNVENVIFESEKEH